MNRLFSGTYTMEVPIIAGTSDNITLTQPLDLYGKRIKHVEICDDMTVAPSGATVYTGAGQITMTEFNTRAKKIYDLNFDEMRTSTNLGNMLFINKIIDFSQSSLTIPNAGTYAGQSVLILIYYDEPSQMGFVPAEGQNRTTFDSFELPILNTTKTRWTFPENNELRGKKFQQLMLQVNCPTPSGYAAISQTVAKNAYITLKRNNYEFIKQLPLWRLYQVGDLWALRFQNIVFDFTNSYIDFISTAGITPGVSSVYLNCINDDN